MLQVSRLALCALVLAACSPPAQSAAQSVDSTQTVAPTLGVTATAQPIATIIAEITEIAREIAGVYILAPGEGSRVVSPLDLHAELAAGHHGLVRVELVDAAGRLMARQVRKLEGTELQLAIPFEVNTDTQARLTIRTQDEYGRIQALNSVELTLLPAGGEAQLLPAQARQRIRIAHPAPGESVPAGSVLLAGTALTPPNRPLNVQLITREERVLLSREVYLGYAEGMTTGKFELQLDLGVDEETWVQIAVSERSGTRMLYFAGVEVLVVP